MARSPKSGRIEKEQISDPTEAALQAIQDALQLVGDD